MPSSRRDKSKNQTASPRQADLQDTLNFAKTKNKKSPSVRIGRGYNYPDKPPIRHTNICALFYGSDTSQTTRGSACLLPARLGSDVHVAYSAVGLAPSPIRLGFFCALLSSSTPLGFSDYTRVSILFFFSLVNGVWEICFILCVKIGHKC